MDMLGANVGDFDRYIISLVLSDVCLKSGLQSGRTDSHLLHAHDFTHALSHGSATLECAQTLPSRTDYDAFMHKSNEPYEAELLRIGSVR